MSGNNEPLPDFITSANLELMVLESFLFFLMGAISTVLFSVS